MTLFHPRPCHGGRLGLVLLAALCVVLVAPATFAETPAGVPYGPFDITVRAPPDSATVRRHLTDGPFCEYFDNGLWAVLGIDIPVEDDSYTVQYPGVEFRGTLFGLDLKQGLAQIRVYFGPYRYPFAIGGDFEPEYYQWLLRKAKGHYRVDGDPDGGRLLVLVDGLKSFEGPGGPGQGCHSHLAKLPAHPHPQHAHQYLARGVTRG